MSYIEILLNLVYVYVCFDPSEGQSAAFRMLTVVIPVQAANEHDASLIEWA